MAKAGRSKRPSKPRLARMLSTSASSSRRPRLAVCRALPTAKRGRRLDEADVDNILAKRGLLGRLLRPAFAMIERSWQLYPLGLLFGLGFDTATEVGVLGISAAQAAHGLSIWSILIFPALFTAAMSLMDTTDSTVMVGTYGRAFVHPIRKLHYNMTITFASVVAALVVGGIEALRLIGDKLGLEGPMEWRFEYDLWYVNNWTLFLDF